MCVFHGFCYTYVRFIPSGRPRLVSFGYFDVFLSVGFSIVLSVFEYIHVCTRMYIYIICTMESELTVII